MFLRNLETQYFKGDDNEKIFLLFVVLELCGVNLLFALNAETHLMYFTPQDSKSFIFYNDNMKFSHKGNMMVGLEFGWNLRYD